MKLILGCQCRSTKDMSTKHKVEMKIIQYFTTNNLEVPQCIYNSTYITQYKDQMNKNIIQPLGTTCT